MQILAVPCKIFKTLFQDDGDGSPQTSRMGKDHEAALALL